MSARLLPVLGILAFVVAACSGTLAAEGPAPEAAPDPRGGLAAKLATPVAQPPDLVVPAADWKTDFGIADVPLAEIQASVPRDAIPTIDEPRFESLADAQEWMDGRAPVIALEIDGDARAYPLSILLWHEIVNDEVGSLRFSDMVMYDRTTESWWQQATGRAIIGGLTGAALEFVPSQVLSLNAFEAAYPEGTVLSRETGFARPYGDNPFLGYGDANEPPFRFDGAIDGRLAPKERVVSVGGPDSEAIAFSYFDLAEVGVAEETFEGQPIVVLWTPGTAGSFDSAVIGLGDDIGSAGVFSPIVDGRELTFVRDDDGVSLRDVETDSTWSVTGRAIDGALEGTQLEGVLHGDHFWFSWAAFTPDTRVWQP